MSGIVQVLGGRATAIQPLDGEAAEILSRVEAVAASMATPFATVALAASSQSLVAGETVVTLGYWSEFDGGDAVYLVRALADYQADRTADGYSETDPDDLIDHLVDGGLLVLELQHNRVIDTRQCGVREGVESSAAWNNAFWRAAALAAASDEPVKFVGMVNVLAKDTLHISQKPSSAFRAGSFSRVEIYHPGSITAVGGGDFEAHLNAEMARLTTLHGSAVTLGSALAAQFLKADPQIPVFLGDKIERPLPLISFCNRSEHVVFSDITCDFWCSGLRINNALGTEFDPGMRVSKFRKYGLLYTKNNNNAIKSRGITSKQWSQTDFTDNGGRMMPGGYLESRNFTGDAMAVLQKDMQFFDGNTGWSRTAVTLLDKCKTNEDDRWAGRTIYPDYFTRWDDAVWDEHGGQINQPEWDYMTPSTGCGDCIFELMHVMQGTALDEDGERIFRTDGLDFGGQTGWENWNSTNPVHVLVSDNDSSVIQCFGENIRFYQTTGGGSNASKLGSFAPRCRFYAWRSEQLNTAHFESNAFTIGVFPFDRGRDGVPDIHSFPGDYSVWNARNRVSSGDYTGPVQYRGQLSGGSGDLPSSSVTTVGDFFWCVEAGTYGGEVFAKGDMAYAVTLAPGTTFGANWRHGVNLDIEATQEDRSVAINKPTNILLGGTGDDKAVHYTKPGGSLSLNFETGLTEGIMRFNGDDWEITAPDQIKLLGAAYVRVPRPLGYGAGAGQATVTQTTSITTTVAFTVPTPTMSIQLFTTSGTTARARFTVTNSLVGVADTIIPTQRSGSNKYRIDITNIAAGSFEVMYEAMIGTATETPVFNFNILAGSVN